MVHCPQCRWNPPLARTYRGYSLPLRWLLRARLAWWRFKHLRKETDGDTRATQ